MKAAICPASGPPEVLKYTNVGKPGPRANELLVKVRSATVTSGDVNMRRFPRVLLWTVGAIAGFKPMKIPGIEYAGEVVEVGPMTAMQLIKGSDVQPGDWAGQSVLVYGASGSVGSYAVQLARHFGAEVTAVCSSANIDLVQSIEETR